MSSTYLDLTAMNAALKELYDGQKVENLVYQDNPWLAMVPKSTDFGGKNKPIPIVIGTSQGRSATFSNAQGNQVAAVVNAFALTRKHDYSIATIDNETMLSSKADKMAFLQGAELLVDAAFRAITNSLASALYRSGTGTIGQLSSISTGVITLADATQVTQFELNMTLQANATDGGGSPRAALGYVVAVDRTAGTVTVASSGLGGSAASPSGWTTNDYLLVQGDNNQKVSGLQAWLPDTAPSSTAFYGVDRSVDVVRLGGVRYDGSALPIEEALIDGAALVAREGGKVDTALMSFASYGALEKALGSKVQYIDLKGPGEIAFQGIRVNGANSQIKVIPDRNCVAAHTFLLQSSTWDFASLGEAPQILKYGDGLETLRVYNADAGEVRVGYYANLATRAPGWNAAVKLAV